MVHNHDNNFNAYVTPEGELIISYDKFTGFPIQDLYEQVVPMNRPPAMLPLIREGKVMGITVRKHIQQTSKDFCNIIQNYLTNEFAIEIINDTDLFQFVFSFIELNEN